MKHLFILAVIALVVSFTISLHSQIPTDGLVAYYPFNGNANDESGNNYNGTVTGAALLTDRFGNANSAYSFYGANDSIVTTLKHFATDNELTVSVWVKGGSDDIYCLMNSDFGVWAVNNGIGLAIWLPSTNSTSDIVEDTSVWTHFVGTYDGTTIKAYINGAAANTVSWPGTIYDVNRNLSMGRFLSFNWDGSLDDIGIYDRVLTQAGVDSLYNDVSTGNSEMTFDKSASVSPNPVDEESTIRYTLDAPENITLQLTDISGRVLKTYMLNKAQPAGKHTQMISFDKTLPAGNYLLSLYSATRSATIKIVR